MMPSKRDDFKTNLRLCDVAPEELQAHPINAEIYGTQGVDPDMLASVKELGILEPIRTTKDLLVLSGHRRLLHAIEAKCKTVPVLICQHAMNEQEQVIALVESNRQREKTMFQKAREFSRLSVAKAELARKRQSAAGKARHGKLGGKFPEAEKGRAKDQAAEQVGLSRKTADKAVAVVKKIDELAAAGEFDKADELREKLNSGSVSAAHRAATNQDHDGETVNSPPVAAPHPGPRIIGKGIELANDAINCLMRIPPNDAFRDRAFEIVSDWIANNRKAAGGAQ